MALTLVVKSTIIQAESTTDAAIAAVLNGVTVAHVYGVGIIPINNNQARVTMVYD